MTTVHSSILVRSRRRWLATSVALATTGAVLAVGGVASAAHAPVGLGTADPFAVLAGSTVTNTGPSVIDGDLGLSAGSDVTGFPPGLMTGGGVQHVADAVALQAQADLGTAYDDAAGRSVTATVTADLGGQTFFDGTYVKATDMSLDGTVTLDAQDDPDAVFIFRTGSTLITAPDSTVALVNGADPCNVFWQVGSSATLDTNTTFVGTVMAMASISALTGTDVRGRLLARTGAVTLDSNTITAPDCDDPTTTTSVPPTSEPTESSTPTTTVTTADTTAPTTPATTETSVPVESTETTSPVIPTTTVINGLPIPIPIPIPLLPPGDDAPGGPDQPPVGDGQPPSGPGTPPVDGAQPPVVAGQPPVNAGQPPVDAGQPPVDAGQPPAGPGQPPVDAGQPPVDAGQPPVGGGYIIPEGYPDTGAGGVSSAAGAPREANVFIASLVALTLVGSALAAGQAFRLHRRQR